MIAASAATSVLPLPTSPCSSRYMGCASAMSCAISASTRFCAPVGRKGSISLTRSRTRSVSLNQTPGCSRALARFNSRPHSSQKNSSKINRYCAGARNAFSTRKSAFGGGKCSSRMAVQRSGNFSCTRMCSGNASSRSGAMLSRILWISVRSARVATLPAAS